MTAEGPDSGRMFPLTRVNLTVGRSSAQAQIRDPWLSAHDFDIRLSSNGPIITPAQGKPIYWKAGETFVAGTTSFKLHRGAGEPLRIPKQPKTFEISCGQPPSPPNVLLQVIGAAAPLMIGIVLMVVTGMWYFLLFSGISVIIAVVLIAQYRRSRRRFVEKIRAAIEAAVSDFHGSIFTPEQMMLALTADGPDPLALAGSQPQYPVLHLGTGVRKAAMQQVVETLRWQPHLSARVDLVVQLKPGHRTVVTGDPDILHALKNWTIVQLLRHVRATRSGLVIDGVHVGGSPVVEISQYPKKPDDSHVHHLIFTRDTEVVIDSLTTHIDLADRRIEGPWVASDVVPAGMSRASLDLITYELGLDQPNDQLSSDYLEVSPQCMRGQAITELVTSLGTGSLGLNIDLVPDGPHVLITGTTGSGKSELLLTLLAGLIERYPPCEVSMILLDFKGGSSFNVLAPLPHTVSVETNHVAATSFRSLKAIAAELFRRESLFADHQVADYAAFRSKAPHIDLPRLVVAIDELRVLIEQNPEASTILAHLASTGRSLGFHLVIATQRTQGAVSADIRANIGSLICLRTATEHDSWEVLGTAEAFSISPTTPGRAYHKAGSSTPRLFQTSRYLLNDEPIVLQPCEASKETTLPVTTDWPALIQRFRQQAASLPVPDPVLLPALPQQIDKSFLHLLPASMGASPIGLVDDPTRSAQYPVYLGHTSDPGGHLVLSGSVAWIGSAGSGIAETLAVVAEYVAGSDVETVFLDGRPVVGDPNRWDTYLHYSEANADILQHFMADIKARLRSNTTVVMIIADWGSWANALVTGSFQGFDEQLIHLLRQYSMSLKIYVFGGRELAGGRLLGMIPDRFYLPKNSSTEHQMIWPKLVEIPSLISRAVLVTAEKPSGGWEVQLADG
ncbi:FtsK/SpoIIIE domain-containing protein [Enteractinococcus coprophilus]|uniref:FtsK/SpoIIIE domain-containing protein n=1 Tax=Enteractinococcus coprophilus TaxID=1027633 RepID=UPI0014775B29|nr:FtsK/SpoIIIE domain-containing protein [Enteractinococcus coprophilus]